MQSSALAAPYGNYGDIENTGLEIALNAHPIVTKDFDWSSDVTISINKNKLKSLSGSTALLGKGQWSDVVSRSCTRRITLRLLWLRSRGSI